jgi:spore protease
MPFGPKVISNLEITRHLLEYVPQYVKPGTRPVCGVAPGVLGTTGIETGEIIKGIVEKIKPNLLIAIDALASKNMERVSTTIQIADTGIVPGSGVNNSRNAISKETLGIPVIAIGVPTVVDAATIANDALEMVFENMKKGTEAGSDLYNVIGRLEADDKHKLIEEVLTPTDMNFVVTPKEIDDIITNASEVVANSINLALHNIM